MSCYVWTRGLSFPIIAAVLMALLTIPASVVKGQNAAEFDIVLANGRVIDPDDAKPSTLAMREFNHRIAHEPTLASTLIPVRDGLTLSLVRHP